MTMGRRKVAVDVCIGREGRYLLRWAGHEVVARARHGESDRAWFYRARLAGAEIVISTDADLEILAFDAGIEVFKHRHGEGEIAAIARFLSTFGAPALTEKPSAP